ncbi:MAG: hypothetical protein LBL04_04805 [Bacteroidales bacterium]|jgi:hypothetical protein|nr:hypothetical protein [Bacteroidales bacterium]
MSLRNQPYLPLYVEDFLTDEKLIFCSAATTGVYIRLMCLMHKSEEYGKICYNKNNNKTDNKIDDFAGKLTKQMPYSFEEIRDALDELLRMEVIHFSGEKLIQKRMVKDGDLSEKRRKSGKKGMASRWNTELKEVEICYNKNDNKTVTNSITNTEYEYEDIKSILNNNKKGGVGENKKSDAGKKTAEEKTWRDSFDIYLSELEAAYSACIQDRVWLDERQKYHPRLNILLTIEKAFGDYWATEAGWKKKKASRGGIDWRRTFNNALTMNGNKVWNDESPVRRRQPSSNVKDVNELWGDGV